MLNNQEMPSMPLLIEDLGMMYAKETSKNKTKFGLYQCSCGTKFKAIQQNVKRGMTKSCGCHKIKVSNTAKKHGMSDNILYYTHANMIRRCKDNQSTSDYKNYFGRGITVCDRWLDVKNFIEDMYPTYKDGLSIDRINNDLGYSKDNCRWTDSTIQSCNTRIIRKNNNSGYRGVSFDKSRNKYRATIDLYKKQIHLGRFLTALEAAKAYDRYVIDNNLEHTINGVLTLDELRKKEI